MIIIIKVLKIIYLIKVIKLDKVAKFEVSLGNPTNVRRQVLLIDQKYFFDQQLFLITNIFDQNL